MPLRVLKLEPDWYTPKREAEAKAADPKYAPCEFLIGPLAFKDRAHVQNLLNSGEVIGDVVAYIIVRCLKGWRNVQDANGLDVEFKPDKAGRVTEEQLALLPWPLVSELALEVKRRSDLTEEERKN